MDCSFFMGIDMRFETAWVCVLAAGIGTFANAAGTAPPASEEPVPVETRATVRSIAYEGEGSDRRTYIHLKLLPRAKLPFTTQRFRVRDPASVAGLSPETPVKFRAERLEGENTLVSIRAVAACVRFQPWE
jgi:Cu/Ag efflux protein CusF